MEKKQNILPFCGSYRLKFCYGNQVVTLVNTTKSLLIEFLNAIPGGVLQ
jgi:hypothetical protein